MFELGIGEMLVIAIVIVVLFGPDKLPSIARDLGQGVRKMKGAVEDMKTEIMKEVDNPVSEIKKEIEKVKELINDMEIGDLSVHIDAEIDAKLMPIIKNLQAIQDLINKR